MSNILLLFIILIFMLTNNENFTSRVFSSNSNLNNKISPLLYDYQPNSNAFRNYYRVGYDNSKVLGWKPNQSWDELRPEKNECPDCFTKSYII